jgi:hypothetical protein
MDLGIENSNVLLAILLCTNEQYLAKIKYFQNASFCCGNQRETKNAAKSRMPFCYLLTRRSKVKVPPARARIMLPWIGAS